MWETDENTPLTFHQNQYDLRSRLMQEKRQWEVNYRPRVETERQSQGKNKEENDQY